MRHLCDCVSQVFNVWPETTPLLPVRRRDGAETPKGRTEPKCSCWASTPWPPDGRRGWEVLLSECQETGVWLLLVGSAGEERKLYLTGSQYLRGLVLYTSHSSRS